MRVIVIGLGAMGSAAAQHLAERGCEVVGFDQFVPPHVYGSSHGLTRIFRQAYFEDHRYVPLLMRAFELWQRLEQDSGERLLHLPGSLVIGPRDGELVVRSAESAQAFDLHHELLDAAELKGRFPSFTVSSDTHALLETNAGYLRPEACIQQQLRQAVRAGAQLHTSEQVLAWQASDRGPGVTVRTSAGDYTADHLVITAGPWAPPMLASMGLPMRVTRQVLCWFQPQESIAAFTEDHFPVYLIEGDGQHPLIYGFPLTGPAQEGLKVALHALEEVCTPDTVDRAIRPSDEAIVRERLATTLPSLAGKLLRAETCLYTMTPDEHFLIGPHPSYPGVTVAAGFSGHGFKFAQVIGEILGDLVVERRSRHNIDLFSIERFSPAQERTPAGVL